MAESNYIEILITPTVDLVLRKCYEANLRPRRDFLKTIVREQLELTLSAIGQPERICNRIRDERIAAYETWFDDGDRDSVARVIEDTISLAFSSVISAL